MDRVHASFIESSLVCRDVHLLRALIKIGLCLSDAPPAVAALLIQYAGKQPQLLTPHLVRTFIWSKAAAVWGICSHDINVAVSLLRYCLQVTWTHNLSKQHLAGQLRATRKAFNRCVLVAMKLDGKDASMSQYSVSFTNLQGWVQLELLLNIEIYRPVNML